MIGCPRKIHFLKIIIIINLIASQAIASIENCSEGHELLRANNTKDAITKLLICSDFLYAQTPKKNSFVVQVEYMLARSYFDLKNYTSFQAHAEKMNWAINIGSLNETFNNPLTIVELKFIKDSVESLEPRYRSSVRAISQINFSLSEQHGCSSIGLDRFLIAAGKDQRIEEFENCTQNDNSMFRSFYPQGNTVNDNCGQVISKYKDCLILYCNNGILQDRKPMFETGPRRMTCDQKEVAFYLLSDAEKLLSFQDQWNGPIDYELKDSLIKIPPLVAIDPFNTNVQ
jgi:hypothetical protein